MIVSASYRTDIPAFYGRWFRSRFREGTCTVANPYGGRPYIVPLHGPQVDGYIFWTRNIGPFIPALEEVAAAGLPFILHLTVTGYPRPLETAVMDASRAMAQMHHLARLYGPRAVVWRYDPILLTDLTPPDFHRANLARLARGLTGATDEVVVSFANIYRKTHRNLDLSARQHGFHWRDPDPEERLDLLTDLAPIAADHGMALTLCTQPSLDAPGTAPAACVDAARLSDVAGRTIAARRKGNRPGCFCAESRDIGAYDSCPHGCVYCYAVRHRDVARRFHKAHDPDASALSPQATVSTLGGGSPLATPTMAGRTKRPLST